MNVLPMLGDVLPRIRRVQEHIEPLVVRPDLKVLRVDLTDNALDEGLCESVAVAAGDAFNQGDERLEIGILASKKLDNDGEGWAP